MYEYDRYRNKDRHYGDIFKYTLKQRTDERNKYKHRKTGLLAPVEFLPSAYQYDNGKKSGNITSYLAYYIKRFISDGIGILSIYPSDEIGREPEYPIYCAYYASDQCGNAYLLAFALINIKIEDKETEHKEI